MGGPVFDVRLMHFEVIVAQLTRRLAASDIHPVIEESRGYDFARIRDPVQQEDLCMDDWPESASAVFLLDAVVKVIELEISYKIPEYRYFFFFSRHAANNAISVEALVAKGLGRWAT